MGKFAKQKKAISEQDMFGHVIQLNFDKQGDSHKTAIGGVFSIFIKIAMFTYVFMNFKKMLLNEQDSNSIEYNLIELDGQPETKFNETNFMMFHIIRK